jgi:CheY-like chemotaxis protein
MVEHAESGPAALARVWAARDRGERYDLVVLDYLMPGMDGLDVARTIARDAATRCPMLLLSSYTDRTVTSAAEAAGIARCLTKPIRRRRLLAECRLALGLDARTATTPPSPAPCPAVQPDMGVDAPRGPVGPVRILAAEDNRVNQQLLQAMLIRLGIPFDLVADGRRAVDAHIRTPYTLILMDCQMPDMDGYEATRRIREHEGDRAHTPIIALTANALEGDRERCLAAGMDDYLAKPFKADSLRALLDRWLPQRPRNDGDRLARNAATPSA